MMNTLPEDLQKFLGTPGLYLAKSLPVCIKFQNKKRNGERSQYSMLNKPYTLIL